MWNCRGVARIFPWGRRGGGGRSDFFFLEKCSLLVNRLGRTSECYIEVQQKRGMPSPLGPSPFWLRLWIVNYKYKYSVSTDSTVLHKNTPSILKVTMTTASPTRCVSLELTSPIWSLERWSARLRWPVDTSVSTWQATGTSPCVKWRCTLTCTRYCIF